MDNENKPSFMFDDRYNQNPIKAKYRIDHDDPTKFDLKRDQIKILLYLLIIPLIMVVMVLLIKINPGNRINLSVYEAENWYVLVVELIGTLLIILLEILDVCLVLGFIGFAIQEIVGFESNFVKYFIIVFGTPYIIYELLSITPIVLLLMICPPVLFCNIGILWNLTKKHVTWFAQKCIVNGKYKTWTSYVLNNVDPTQKSKHRKSINLIATVFAVGLFIIVLTNFNYILLSVCVPFSMVPIVLYYYAFSLKMSPDYLYNTDDIEIAIGYRRKIEYEKKQKEEEKNKKKKRRKKKRKGETEKNVRAGACRFI